MRISFLSGPQESQAVKARGETHGRSKLKEWQVNLMLDMFEWGYEPKYLAVVFSIALSTVYSIISGDRWKHVHHGRSQRTKIQTKEATQRRAVKEGTRQDEPGDRIKS
jgi:hypothetical protein